LRSENRTEGGENDGPEQIETDIYFMLFDLFIIGSKVEIEDSIERKAGEKPGRIPSGFAVQSQVVIGLCRNELLIE
jgi:hypothetical protein